MFFEGTLQDGISTALQQAKQVVCFVTDDGTESQQWENEFLKDDSIRPELESQSVLLRLVAGTEEAGYLEALFPIPKKPTVVVIQNGQLKEYIAAGTTKAEFIRRLGQANQPRTNSNQPSSSPAATITPSGNTSQSNQNTITQPSQSNDALYDEAATAVAPTNSSAPARGNNQSVTAATATEEDKRFTAEQKGKAKATTTDASTEAGDPHRRPDGPPNPEQAHANEIKLRKQQANEERRRILKRIEDDKRARKERDAAERRARALLSADPDANTGTGMEATGETESIPLSTHLSKATSSGGTGNDSTHTHCNLQIRLLDGSTMRTRFPASSTTLSSGVRNWIDSERTDGDTPYSFRVMLAPLPNRAISPGEEAETLQTLGLAPSATLVLVPARHSLAYARGGGILSPVLGAVERICGAIIASVGGWLALFFGGGGGTARGDGGHGRDDIPMENLRRRRDNQLYNGNSLNFEPRKDDDDDGNSNAR
ncbi:hypothetical protein F4777DRAFT_266992 [Nemania sp. FL0916]|nr:hypothetical protein F4777DRAFT_266992 [Nemania sp. FL0916]